jgi:predicted ATPase
MINQINIERFKCFDSSKINFRQLTVFAGSNSAGKSSIIQSILLSRSAIDKIKLQNLPLKAEDRKVTIPLNGTYRLALGDSKEVLNRNNSDNSILISITEGKESHFNFLSEEVIENVFHIDLTKWDTQEASILYNQEFHYLNAERIGPRSRHEMDDLEYANVGWQGEYTIQVLHEKRENEIAATKNLNVSNTVNSKLLPLVREWMGYIIPGFYIDEIKAYEKIKSAGITINKSIPTNVGFGVSYVLPIVVSGLICSSNTILIVENPEAHLHPSGQSRIGRFLARVAASGVQVIIETHSEHIINGIRVESVKKNILHETVLVNFLNRPAEKGIEMKEIDISESGNFTQFPSDFFDQVQQDMSDIFEVQTKLK